MFHSDEQHNPRNASFVCAGTLFLVAKKAYERADANPTYRSRPVEAITALVFSVNSLEAFINEAIWSALKEPIDWPDPLTSHKSPDSVKTFALLGKEAMGHDANLRLKFMLARLAFTGAPFEKGTNPYQDFDYLLRLRNDIVHRIPSPVNVTVKDWNEAYTKSRRGLLRGLEARQLLSVSENSSDSEFAPVGDWISMLKCPDAERWACETAIAMVRSVLDVVPNCWFKKTLECLYGRTFTLSE